MNIVITGGGTMGHVTPALAIIESLKKRCNATFTYIGSISGVEQIVTKKEKTILFFPISIHGLNRKNIFINFRLFKELFVEGRRVKKLFKKIQPDIVIGTGGYVSFIPLWIAKRLNIPYVIHEQNSVPGLSNIILSKKSSLVMLSYYSCLKYFKNNTLLTGNPSGDYLKKTLKGKSYFKKGYKNVLIVGGSLGAKSINDAFLKSYHLFKNENIFVLFISGKKYIDDFKNIHDENILVLDYLDDMASALYESDLVVSRAGATTISEILAFHKPSILIPSPNVTANHQMKNAEVLYKKGASLIIEDDKLTGDVLFLSIKELLHNEERYKQMGKMAKELFIEDSDVIIGNKIMKLMGE